MEAKSNELSSLFTEGVMEEAFKTRSEADKENLGRKMRRNVEKKKNILARDKRKKKKKYLKFPYCGLTATNTGEQ